MNFSGHGICRLSIIPVRSTPGDTSEMVNQLLFGEHYTILEASEDKKWLKIKSEFDGYEGWIDHKQHHHISEDYFTQINNSDYKISTDITSSILFQRNNINIVMGSILPITTNELFKMEEQLAFNGESISVGQRRDFEFLNQIARKYLNAPYLWGGRTPFGIDCSGLVQQIFRICGYKLPRDSADQAASGTPVAGFSAKFPGDLAFFNGRTGKIAHVGIILEAGSIIHASGHVRIDALTEDGILNEDTNQHTHPLAGIRRVLKIK